MTLSDVTSDAPRLRDHWWSRPGWRPGRLTYTWHLTFETAPALHRLADAYREALQHLPGLHPVPARWLHLTMQNVGYTDQISDTQLTATTDAVHRHLADLAPFEVTFHRPHVLREAIVLPPAPSEPVHVLYTRIREALTAVLGPHAVPTSPEQTRGYRPHVSVAYSSTTTPVEPYLKALNAVDPAPATITIDSAQLIRQERLLQPHWLYRWDLLDTASLGTS